MRVIAIVALIFMAVSCQVSAQQPPLALVAQECGTLVGRLVKQNLSNAGFSTEGVEARVDQIILVRERLYYLEVSLLEGNVAQKRDVIYCGISADYKSVSVNSNPEELIAILGL